MAAEAFVLFLDKKNQKSSHLHYASFRTRPLPSKAGHHHGLFRFAPLASPALRPSLHADLKGPLQPHKAAMCCPAFSRSWEDDKGQEAAGSEQQWQ